MGNKLSSKLAGKGMDLRSMTIDSPAGRTIQKGDNKGNIARCTVYFDKWSESGEGRSRKFKPVKGATLYTKVEADAEAIDGCVCHDIKNIKVDGSLVYFKYDTLTDEEKAEFDTYKGRDTIDVVANDLLGLLKKATCQAIMALPKEDRERFANFWGSEVVSMTNKLTSKTVNKKKQRITLWNEWL